MTSSIPKGTHFLPSHPFISKVYSATSTDETQKLYDEWAAQYDKDLADEEYASPELTVEAVVKHLNRGRVAKGGDGSLRVLDAGCGTGLVGLGLAAKQSELLRDGLGELRIDGIDLSQGMLDVARKTMAYGNLETADLSQPLKVQNESYDIVTCVGTLTKAHVGAGVLKEFVRVSRRGCGLVVATILEEIYEEGGYKSVIFNELGKYGRVEVISIEDFGIRKGQQSGGKMVVLRRKYYAEEIAHAGIGA